MSRYTVYFRGTRAEARGIAQRLAGILTGREADTLNIARGVFNAVGFAALSDIKADFVRKSRGETGEDGVKWKPLSKEYLAYGRRFGIGEKSALKKAAGLDRKHSKGVGGKSGLLTSQQQKRWNQIFAQTLHRLMLSLSESEAKSRAAAIAWATIKREGAKTKLEVFGNRVVDINRDTGMLLNSLSPGELSGGAAGTENYEKPSGDGGSEQVFQSLRNGIIVGTNVAYAAAVNKQRPFLPQGEPPEVWKQRWLNVANDALLAGAYRLFTQGAV